MCDGFENGFDDYGEFGNDSGGQDDEKLVPDNESNLRFPEWHDWMIVGPLSEEIANERRRWNKFKKMF